MLRPLPESAMRPNVVAFLLMLSTVSVALPAHAAAIVVPPSAPAVDAAAALLEAKDAKAGPAVAALRRAHPDDTSVGVLQVRWLLQQGEREDALELAEDLVDDAPKHAQAQYWLGN